MRDRVFLSDTALIDASLFDDAGVNPLPATSVSWQIKKPDGSIVSGGPDSVDETAANIAYNATDLVGNYSAQIQFTLQDSTKRSTVLTFEVVDPLETTTQAANTLDAVIDRGWMKLEDLFDSELGGPHLRDRTLANFDRDKMERLLPDALYTINNWYQPVTGYDTTTFPFDSQAPLLSQALLVEAIYHLMRSYVEQPSPLGGANSGYFDRRDYLQRWQMILTGEEKKLTMWMDLFKRGELNLGSSSLLIGGYANWNTRYPRYMRGRYPYYAFRW